MEYQRRLPHVQRDGAHLFVTWRLAGSLPPIEPDIIYATAGHEFAAKDRLLARARGTRWLDDSRVADRVAESILAGAAERKIYELGAWVVMPNHVHILMLPKEPLRQITQWVKGRTAREANSLLGRTGQAFWQDESFDRWVRDRREFDRIVAYIEENPVSAGLAVTPGKWRWSSAGWAS